MITYPSCESTMKQVSHDEANSPAVSPAAVTDSSSSLDSASYIETKRDYIYVPDAECSPYIKSRRAKWQRLGNTPPKKHSCLVLDFKNRISSQTPKHPIIAIVICSFQYFSHWRMRFVSATISMVWCKKLAVVVIQKNGDCTLTLIKLVLKLFYCTMAMKWLQYL